MKAMKHIWAHSKHAVTGLPIPQVPLYPFQTGHLRLPAQCSTQMLFSMHGIFIHSVEEGVLVFIFKAKFKKIEETIIPTVIAMACSC